MQQGAQVPEAVLPADVHNERLVAHVHPPDWRNPTPQGRYNLVVVGGGTAGLVTAAGAAGLGAKVALVEKHLLGGDCLNYGCVPSKALLRAARAATEVARAGEFGIRVPQGAVVDFSAVMERMRRLRAGLSPHDSAQRFSELGVDVFLGIASFAGHDSLRVNDQTLQFRKAVIATGARAGAPPIPGLVETGCLTNETVFSLTALPRRLAVIGAGPIGCELAQAFARFGASVDLLEVAPRILLNEDEDAAQRVANALAADGVRIHLRASIAQASRTGTAKILELTLPDGPQKLIVDEILVGVGRIPNVAGFGLETAGVAFDPRQGVTVNDRLQTTNPRIFAAGDVCSRYRFTHAADAMARIVIQNALFLGRAKLSALTIPWCTYTDPELAHVGLHVHDARAQGIEVDTFEIPLERVDRAVLDGQTDGFLKLHVRKGGDRILGGTVVAAHAGDLVSEIALAMTAGIGLKQIARTVYPYPTQAEALKKAADLYNRTRLTPRVQSLLRKWLAWSRR